MQHFKAGGFGALVFGLVGWNASPDQPILMILAAVAGFSAGYFGYRFSETWSATAHVLEKTLGSTVAFLKRPHPFLYPGILGGLASSNFLWDFGYHSHVQAGVANVWRSTFATTSILSCYIATATTLVLLVLAHVGADTQGFHWKIHREYYTKENDPAKHLVREIPYTKYYSWVFSGVWDVLKEAFAWLAGTVKVVGRGVGVALRYSLKLLHFPLLPLYILWQVVRLVHSGERVMIGSYGVIGGASCHFAFSAWQLALFPHLFSVLCGMIVAGALAEAFGRRLVRHPIFKFA